MRELGARRAADRGRYVDIDIDRAPASHYGLNIADVQSVIASAVGGETIGKTVEGLARFPISVRYPRELAIHRESAAASHSHRHGAGSDAFGGKTNWMVWWDAVRPRAVFARRVTHAS
jgi:hypothetical protein